jgi:hypothetical protein
VSPCPLPSAAGPDIPPNTPLNIISPNGSYVRSDNSSSPATVGTGTGGTAPEQYLAFHPDNLNSTSPIEPYDTAVLRSVETGLWCRLAPLTSNTTQIGMICDQPTAATGTTLTYTGDGLSSALYQGAAHAGCPGHGGCTTALSGGNRAYGSFINPVDRGSGGRSGTAAGGGGGAALRLHVPGVLLLNAGESGEWPLRDPELPAGHKQRRSVVRCFPLIPLRPPQC